MPGHNITEGFSSFQWVSQPRSFASRWAVVAACCTIHTPVSFSFLSSAVLLSTLVSGLFSMLTPQQLIQNALLISNLQGFNWHVLRYVCVIPNDANVFLSRSLGHRVLLNRWVLRFWCVYPNEVPWSATGWTLFWHSSPQVWGQCPHQTLLVIPSWLIVETPEQYSRNGNANWKMQQFLGKTWGSTR